MKKTLLFASFLCASLVASAQFVAEKPASSVVWSHGSEVTASTSLKAPQKAELNENQVIVGLYTDDSYDKDGLGLGSALTFEVATEIPTDLFVGMNNVKVDGIRFALAQACMIKSVKLYGVSGQGPVLIASKAVNEKCPAGWNFVPFDEPVTFDPSLVELLPAYEITTTASDYPIAVNPKSSDASFLAYGPFSQTGGTTWVNFGPDYGTIAMQLLCTSDPLSGYNVLPKYYDSPVVLANKEFQPVITMLSGSEEAVNNVDYTLNYNGSTMSATADFSPAIPAGFGKSGSFTLSLTAPETGGTIPVELTITKVNGQDITPVTANFAQSVLTRAVPRYSVVEEFTGTGCPWCPRGWVGMEMVKDELSDIAGVIAIHQYNNTDAMYSNAYHTPQFGGAPSCMVDRLGEMDPYDGISNKGIIESVKALNNYILPEVQVTVDAVLSDDLKKVECHASTEFLTDVPGSEIVFVLTGNGLRGTNQSWAQANNYAQLTTPALLERYGVSAAKDPILFKFTPGQEYGQSYVLLTFNDVLLTSSWPNANTANAVEAFSTTKAGEIAESTYALTIPTKMAIKNAIQKDQLYVTAIVFKDAEATIVNAARCHVEMATGIESLEVAPTADAPAYDLSGRVAAPDAKGIFIQNGKKVIR